jgi:outer membrane beta-barrel protein
MPEYDPVLLEATGDLIPPIRGRGDTMAWSPQGDALAYTTPYGARIAYHFTEDVFAAATIASAEAGRTSYEDLSGSVDLLTDSERRFTSYDLSVGWNVLPGEAFLGGTRAMPAALYLTLGAGSTRFGGDDFFTIAAGAGYRLLVTDWLAVHVEARDLIFRSDLLGTDKTTQNLQFTIGLTAFF